MLAAAGASVSRLGTTAATHEADDRAGDARAVVVSVGLNLSRQVLDGIKSQALWARLAGVCGSYT